MIDANFWYKFDCGVEFYGDGFCLGHLLLILAYFARLMLSGTRFAT